MSLSLNDRDLIRPNHQRISVFTLATSAHGISRPSRHRGFAIHFQSRGPRTEPRASVRADLSARAASHSGSADLSPGEWAAEPAIMMIGGSRKGSGGFDVADFRDVPVPRRRRDLVHRLVAIRGGDCRPAGGAGVLSGGRSDWRANCDRADECGKAAGECHEGLLRTFELHNSNVDGGFRLRSMARGRLEAPHQSLRC